MFYYYNHNNQIYFLKTERIKVKKQVVWVNSAKAIANIYLTRKVLSIGIILLGFGRSFDIPLSRWGWADTKLDALDAEIK